MKLWRTAIFAAVLCAIAALGAQIKQGQDRSFHGSDALDEPTDRIGCWVAQSSSVAIHQRPESQVCSDY